MRDNETKMTSCLAKLRTTFFGLDFKINMTSGPLSSRNFQETSPRTKPLRKRVYHTLWKPNTRQPKFTTNGERKAAALFKMNVQQSVTTYISYFKILSHEEIE